MRRLDPQRRHVEEQQRVEVRRRWPPSAEAGWSGGGVGAELGANALVPTAAEARLREAMAALNVGSHEKRRGWRGFGEPRESRSSRRRRPAGQSSSRPRSHPWRGLVEGRKERNPRQSGFTGSAHHADERSSGPGHVARRARGWGMAGQPSRRGFRAMK